MSIEAPLRRLAGLVLLVLITALVSAAAAQAEGEWKIAEQTMTDLEAPEASIFGTASEKFILSVAWYASEIECSTLATEAPTKIFKGGTGEAVQKLSSCQVLGPPFVSETCKVIEPIQLEVVGELLLHKGKTYELFKGAKSSLGSVKFKEGTECPLPLSNELKGTFVGETEAGERKEQPLTFNSTIESLFSGDTLSFGTHPATLKGKSTWALAAGYKGLKWAAVGKNAEEEWERVGGTTKGSGVLELNVGGKVSAGELLASLYENRIHCNEGNAESAQMKLATDETMTTLSVSGTVTLPGCVELQFPTCEVKSVGQPLGTIKLEGTGTGSMVGEGSEEVVISLVSSNFGKLAFVGEECPLNEVEEPVSGTINVSLPNAPTEKATHIATLNGSGLKFGEAGLLIHVGGKEGEPITLSLTKEGGGNWAIK